jgi:hypothetical protein
MERKENEAWGAALGPPQLIIVIGVVMMLFLKTRQLFPDFWIVAFTLLAASGLLGLGLGFSRKGHNDALSKIPERLIARGKAPPSDAKVMIKDAVVAAGESYDAVQAGDTYWLQDCSN